MIRPAARSQPYDRHVGRYGSRLGAELVTAAGIARGQRALDVGCGLGALTIELARVLAPVGGGRPPIPSPRAEGPVVSGA